MHAVGLSRAREVKAFPVRALQPSASQMFLTLKERTTNASIIVR